MKKNSQGSGLISGGLNPLKRVLPVSFLLLLAISAGIGIGSIKSTPAFFYLSGLFLFVLVSLWSLLKQGRFFIVFLSCAFFFTGFSGIQKRLYPTFATDHISHHTTFSKTLIQGRIISFADHYTNRVRYVLACESIYDEALNQRIPVSGNIYLTIYYPEHLPEIGDRVEFSSAIKAPRNFANPGAFDYKRYLMLNSIFGTAYTSKNRIRILPCILLKTPKGLFMQAARIIESFRNRFYEFIMAQDLNFQAKSILVSLTTGNRKILDPDVQQSFARAGISHLLAISGLHLSIVGWLAYLIFYRCLSILSSKVSSKLLISGLARKAALLMALIPITGYAVFSGFSPSTQRAWIMAVVLAGTLLFEKQPDLLSGLCLAGIVILLMDCGSLFSISFQLSFMAVFLIFLWVPVVRKIPLPAIPFSRIMEKILMAAGVTLAAGFGTWPIAAHYFHVVSNVQLLSNLVAVPVVGFAVLPMGMAALLCFEVMPVFAEHLAAMACRLIAIIIEGSRQITAWPGTWNTVADLSWPEVILIYILILTGRLLLSSARKKALPAFLIVLVALIGTQMTKGYRQISSSASERLSRQLPNPSSGPLHGQSADQLDNQSPGHPAGRLSVTVLDVGQGGSTFINTAEGTRILVDGGGFSDRSSFDTGRFIVAPFLWQQGIKQLDYVIMTHPESDHMNGLVFILDHFKIGALIKNNDRKDTRTYRELMAVCRNKNIPVNIIEPKGQWLNLKETRLFFLPRPVVATSAPLNNNSLAMKLEYYNFTMLLAADILQDRESFLSQAASDMLASKVLVAAHHGSNSSSSKLFLDHTKPESVIISCGWRNRYGFPHKAVLSRLKKIAATTFRTDINGAVQVTSDGAGYQINTLKGG